MLGSRSRGDWLIIGDFETLISGGCGLYDYIPNDLYQVSYSAGANDSLIMVPSVGYQH